MKKLLFLFSLILLLSCTSKSNGSDTSICNEDEVPFMYVVKFKYEKHSYIKFIDGYRCGVVHDPECKYCLDKYD